MRGPDLLPNCPELDPATADAALWNTWRPGADGEASNDAAELYEESVLWLLFTCIMDLRNKEPLVGVEPLSV